MPDDQLQATELTPEQREQLKLLKRQLSYLITGMMTVLNERLTEMIPTETGSVAVALIAWPMVPGPDAADGSRQYATEGDALMVANVNPNKGPGQQVMRGMLESALRQAQEGAVLRYKPDKDPEDTKH